MRPGSWIWRPTRFAVYERDKWMCVVCLLKLYWCNPTHAMKRGPTLDHVNPNGGDTHTNLVTMCRTHNEAKGTRTMGEYLASLTQIEAEAISARVAVAISKPIDRAAGRRICRKLSPERLRRKR